MRQQADILGLETAGQFAAALKRVVQLLRAGELVALPTETVYGLAANAFDTAAVEKIFQVKGRPSHNPLIVHVNSLQLARECAAHWPEAASRLAAAFWPGPLTVVVRKSERVPDLVTAGGSTVALRWPGHPFIQAVIGEAGFPLAAPSANLSGEISPTTAAHVLRSLGSKLHLIVDAGQSQVGIESTVVDCTEDPPRILRPGIISAEQIAKALHLQKSHYASNAGKRPGPLRSPGLLERHYAPKGRLVIWEWLGDEDLSARVKQAGFRTQEAHIVAHSRIPHLDHFGHVSVIPLDAEAYARAIYAELHQRDEANAQLIVIEELPATPEWEGINDRLRRAGTHD